MTLGAVAFRLLSLDNLTNDHYMYLSLAQQVLLGEWPTRDFVDPGGPLQYLLSTGVQVFAPGPFSEAVLTILLLACAAGATCVVVSWLTASVPAGLIAASFAVVLETRLYGYPKILIPPVAIWLALAYTRRPGAWTRFGLAAWVSIAFLFRHDLGAYSAALAAVVIAMRFDGVRERTFELARLAGVTLLLLVPFFAFIASVSGIPALLYDTIEFAKAEPDDFGLRLPSFTFGSSQTVGSLSVPFFDRQGAAVFLVYAAYALPIVAAVLARTTTNRFDRERTPVVVAAAVMLALYDVVVIRNPLVSRIGDAATLMAIVGAWSLLTVWRAIGRTPVLTPAARVSAQVVLLGVGGMAFVSADVAAKFHDHLRQTRVLGGPGAAGEQLRQVLRDGRSWPWHRYWPGEPIPELLNYVDECTEPDDRLFVTWPAPEYYFLTRRGFAGGHVWFPESGGYRSSEAQQRMIDRFERRPVPIVLIHEERRADLEALSLLDAYVASNYVPAGRAVGPDGASVTIAVRRELEPRSLFGKHGWPCQLEPIGTETGQS